MSNIPRDESLPRVSSLYHFLNEEEFKKIPQDQLAAAAERGNRGHKLIELNWNTNLDNPIVNMFREGLAKVKQWVSENSPGHTIVIDYKFTRDRLRPETAIQLVDYGGLIAEVGEISPGRIAIEQQLNGSRYTGKPDFVIQDSFEHFEYFAFHYHQDGGLFVYRIPKRAKGALSLFAYSLIEHHKAIQEGRQIKYLKMAEWERLQLEYEVFEPFYNTMPPMEITTHDKAKQAALLYNTDVKRFEERREQFKREIVRFMESEGKDKIYDLTGGGVHLRNARATKIYDPVKKAKADKVYNKALEDALIETKPNKALYRFNAPKKKQKLIK
jgi:hypothetical protein